jgi:hypothetical protein
MRSTQRVGKEAIVLQVLDPGALSLHGQTQRDVLRATMEASRRGTVRRPLGGLLVNVGERLAPGTVQQLRPAADRG